MIVEISPVMAMIKTYLNFHLTHSLKHQNLWCRNRKLPGISLSDDPFGLFNHLEHQCYRRWYIQITSTAHQLIIAEVSAERHEGFWTDWLIKYHKEADFEVVLQFALPYTPLSLPLSLSFKCHIRLKHIHVLQWSENCFSTVFFFTIKITFYLTLQNTAANVLFGRKYDGSEQRKSL
mgnify:CR=1 FL=1